MRCAPIQTSPTAWFLGVAAIVVMGSFAFGSTVELLASIGVAGLSALVLALRSRRQQFDPRTRRAWALLGAGTATWCAGEAVWAWQQLVHGVEAPFPSLADIGYLASIPFLAAGLYHLQPGVLQRDLRAQLLDGLIVTAATGSAIWILAGPHAGAGAGLSPLGLTLLVAYAVTDVLLVAMVARGLLAGTRRAAIELAAVGVGLIVFADMAAAMPLIPGGIGSSHGLWALAFACFAAASWLPASPGRVESAVVAVTGIGDGLRIVAFVVAATMLLPLATVFAVATGRELDPVFLAAATSLVIALVSARLVRLVTRQEAVLRQLHDAALELRAARDHHAGSTALRALLFEHAERARENERAGLAADLHDVAIQSLAALRYGVEAGVYAGADPTELVELACDGLGREIDGLRRIIAELRPPALDEQGVVAAISDSATAFGRRAGIDVVLRAQDGLLVDPRLEVVLYRIVQQGLDNVDQHAVASRAVIELRNDGNDLCLTVTDDGGGVDAARVDDAPARGNFGLAMMRERVEFVGGDLEIRNLPRGGARLAVTIPGGGMAIAPVGTITG